MDHNKNTTDKLRELNLNEKLKDVWAYKNNMNANINVIEVFK